MYLNDVYTVTVNLAGLPGISVPIGLAGNGLPLGLQLIGRPWEEGELLALAAALEARAGFTARPRNGGSGGIHVVDPSRQHLLAEGGADAPLPRRADRTAGGQLDLSRPGADGEIGHSDDSIAYYGSGNRGIHAVRPIATFPRDNGLLHNPTVGGHVAITVDDLDTLIARLDRARIPYSDAGVYAMRGVRQIYVYDPSWNVVEFNQVVDTEGRRGAGGRPTLGGRLGLEYPPRHLQAHDVRETAGFFAEIAGMEEGRWTRPEGADEGAFSIDPAELTIFPLGDGNRGLHIIRPDPLFGQRNGFVVNPSIGGHPAITVPDIHAVMARMDAAGWHYDDAGRLCHAGDAPDLHL